MNAKFSDRPTFCIIANVANVVRSTLLGDKLESTDLNFVRTCTLRGLDLVDAEINSYYFKCAGYFDELEEHYPVKKIFNTYVVEQGINCILVPRRVVSKIDNLAEELDIPGQKVVFYATIRGLIQHERDEDIDRENTLSRAFDKM